MKAKKIRRRNRVASNDGLCRSMWLVKKGRRSFKKGDDMPDRPDKNDDGSPKFFFWVGYMLERANKLMAQWRARDLLTDPDPFDPRPRKAA